MSARTAAFQTAAPPAARSQLGILLAAVMLAYTGQMVLNPIIAPVSRELGLAEWQVGLTISISAVMVVLFSQFWGRRSQSWGTRRVLVLALAVATSVMALFAGLVWLGFSGGFAGTPLFVLFVLLRGVCYGAAIAAVQPTAQAYIAAVTDDEPARVKGMAAVSAAQGAASVLGALVGGVLAVFGLMVPMVAVPLLLAGGLLVATLRLRGEGHIDRLVAPPRVRPTDVRVWPYLVAGFGMFLAFGFIQVIAGFLVQDRLAVAPTVAASMAGLALLCAGLGMVITQAVLVPRLGWGPHRLLRVGLAGFAALVPSAGLVTILVSMLLIGVGLGFAMPGYVAGPSLSVTTEEQGGLAGLIGATNGLTFIIAPTAATALYAVSGTLPVAISVVLLAAVLTFVWIHPRFGVPPCSPGDTPTDGVIGDGSPPLP